MPQRILVVDDVDHVRKLIRKILAGAGYEVVDFPDAIEASNYLKQQTVDLIISDLMMPEMDGYTFCRKVKSDRRLQDIPFVFVTAAFTDDIDRELAGKVGAQAYITKPIIAAQLLKDIKELLRQSQAVNLGVDEGGSDEVERMYTEVLSRKLDKKVKELEQERAALRKSEEHLRTVTNAIPEQLFELDQDYSYQYMNAAHVNWHGLSDEIILGRRIEEVFPAQAYDIIKPYLDKAYAGETTTFEAEIPDSQGVLATMWIRFIPKYENGKHVAGIYSIISDVSSTVEDKKRLQRVNRALHTLTKINEIIIQATDEYRFFDDVCETLAKEGGYKLVWLGMVENGQNKQVLIISHAGPDASYLDGLKVTWDDSEYGMGPTGMTIKEGRTHVVRNIESDKNYHLWRQRATDHGFASSIAIPIKLQDEVVGTINIYSSSQAAFDSSETKLLEELANDVAFGIQSLRARIQRDYAIKSLKDSEQHLRSIVDTAPSIMFWLSIDKRIHGLNQEGENLLDVKQEDMFGKDFVSEFVDPDSRTDFEEAVRITLEGEPLRDKEIGIIDKNSNKHIISWNMNRLTDENEEMIGIIAVGQDITEQRRAIQERENLQIQLQQAQKMEAIGQLTGGIAHDFNNILASIIGYTELALERYVDENAGKLRSYLKEVHLAGMRAKDLIAQMLAFSRSKHGEYITLNITPLINETIKLLRPTIPASIDLQFNKNLDIHNVHADPVQLQQILMNLCINARDAIKTHGKITVSVKEDHVQNRICDSCHQMFSGHYLTLSVADTGHGIPQDLMGRIFEPFLTTKDVGAGTGMGLSMVHGIVHNHNGHILVKSKENVGTEFRILIPLTGAVDETVDEEAAYNQNRSAHILVVDDEESVSRFIQALLDTQGHRVTIKSNSTQALEYFQQHADQIDMIFTDQTMPGVSGLELAEQVLEIRPEMPIILATGYSHQVNEQMAKEAGIKAFLKKPFDTQLLIDTVTELLKGK
jgi:PAS domain S-box-containing protein